MEGESQVERERESEWEGEEVRERRSFYLFMKTTYLGCELKGGKNDMGP